MVHRNTRPLMGSDRVPGEYERLATDPEGVRKAVEAVGPPHDGYPQLVPFLCLQNFRGQVTFLGGPRLVGHYAGRLPSSDSKEGEGDKGREVL